MTPRSSILQGLVALCLATLMFVPLYFSSSTIFPFIILKATVSHLAILALGVMAAVSLWQSKKAPSLNVLGLALIAYLIVQLAASVQGVNPERSFFSTFERSQGIVSLVGWLLLAFSVSSLFESERSWRQLFQGLVVAACIIAVVALLFVVGAYDAPFLLRDFGRLAFTVGNSAIFGNYLGVLASLAFGLLLLDFRRVSTKFSSLQACQLGLLLFCLLATGSRSGILAFVSCAGLLVLLAPLPRKEKALVVLGVSSLALFAAVFFWDIVSARISATSFSSDSIGYRIEAWKIGWAAFQAKPILGFGPENFIQVFGQYSQINQISNETFDTAHNHLVALLVGSGVLGLLSYMVVVGLALFSLWRHYWHGGEAEQRNVLLVLTVIVSYQVTSLFLFDALVTAPLFFLALAYCLRVCLVRWHSPKHTNVAMFAVSILLLLVGIGYERKVFDAAQQIRTVEAKTPFDEKFKAATALSGGLRHEELLYFFALETWSNWQSLSQTEKVQAKQVMETLIGDSDIVALSWRTCLHISRAYLLFVQDGANNLSELQMLVNRTMQLAPNRPQSHRLMANYFLLTDQPDRARQVLTQYLAKNPDRPAMHDMLEKIVPR